MSPPRTLELAYLPPLDPFSDFEAVCRDLAADGISRIVLQEVCGAINLTDPGAGPRIARVLHDTGIGAIACHGLEHAPYLLRQPEIDARRRMVAAHLDMLRRAADLGARTYVLHLGNYPAGLDPVAAWEPVARALDELAPEAEAAGVALALENSLRVTYLARNAGELADFVGRYGHPAVGVCFDVGHAHILEGVAVALDTLRPHIVTMHLHDNNGRQDQHLIPGRGTLDWAGFIPGIASCPRLRHLETEAIKPPLGGTLAETEQHPPGEVHARYLALLNAPGSGLRVPA